MARNKSFESDAGMLRAGQSRRNAVERSAMRHQYRVTKYDPALRDLDGSFRKETWTASSDIGRRFGGAQLLETEYLRVEQAYLFAVETFLHAAKIEKLSLRGLEYGVGGKMPKHFQSGAPLSLAQCVEFARLALRGQAWGKLVEPGRAFVHFGWDYYMYIGLPARCATAISEVQGKGLFVEAFRSPYLRARPNSLPGRTANCKRFSATQP